MFHNLQLATLTLDCRMTPPLPNHIQKFELHQSYLDCERFPKFMIVQRSNERTAGFPSHVGTVQLELHVCRGMDGRGGGVVRGGGSRDYETKS